MLEAKVKYIIVDGNDVEFFSTKEKAEAYMEAIDVSNGVYTGYDWTGQVLKILPHKNNAQILLEENTKNYAGYLINLISDVLERRGVVVFHKTLDELLFACEGYIR